MQNDNVKKIIRKRIEAALAEGVAKRFADLMEHVARGPVKTEVTEEVLGEMFPEMKAEHVVYEAASEHELPCTPPGPNITIIRMEEFVYQYGARSSGYGPTRYDAVIDGTRYQDVGYNLEHASIFTHTMVQMKNEAEARTAADLYARGTGIYTTCAVG